MIYTLNDYVKNFGHLTFKERPFNNVDACVFVTLAYTNLEVVAPNIKDYSAKPYYFRNLHDFDINILGVNPTFERDNKTLLKLVRKSNRFKDVGICYINKVLDEHITNQFYAATFLLPDDVPFIAFRGTDSTIIGWKEDLELSIQKVIPSQLDALDYLNIVSELLPGKFRVGGHSKGGNLTLYSCISISKDIRDRIVDAYSFDGNGLAKKDYYTSDAYLDIKDRLHFIVPHDCVIGEIFYNPKNAIVVKSLKKGMLQHYPHNWLIDSTTGDFIYLPERTKEARARHRMFKEGVKCNSQDDFKFLINLLVELFGGIGKTTSEFFSLKFKKIRVVIFLYKKDKDERTRTLGVIKNLRSIYKESVKYYKLKDKEERKNIKHGN